MPMDQQGRHRPNPQIARHYDRMSGAGRQAPSPGRAPGGDAEPIDGSEKDSIGKVTVHDHGDGTFHTEHEDGSRVEHPDVTHMAAHLMAHHSPGDKHMAMSHDGMGNMTAHHADENGEVHGPHEGDTEAMAAKMHEVMGEDGGEVPEHGDEDGYSDDIEYGV